MLNLVLQYIPIVGRVTLIPQKLGFIHLTVNHTYNFVDPIALANTQLIENSWGVLKESFEQED
ncbi:hypothetical protein H311_03433 [Anncaliia algerae PRA109]|nr:hypothetical protein H311_03433 [Anncaliia algerae PRA109]